jgi:hypothetical protein
MATKRELILSAFSELGLAAYAFDLQPEQLQEALRRLDAMLATWAGKGIRIGYAGGNGMGEIDTESTIPAWAQDAVTLGLAIRIAPAYGKTPSIDTKANFRDALQIVLGKCVRPSVRNVSGYAGNSKQLAVSQPDIEIGNDGVLNFIGDW